jgi:WD40 repeat protein
VPPKYTNRLVDFVLSPAGDLLAITDWNGALTVFDTAAGTPLWTADGAQALPVWSRDGATIYAFGLVVTTGEYSLRAFDARAGLKWSQPFETSGWSLDVLADGSMLAGITYDGTCPDSICTRYAFWSPVDGTLVSETPGGGGYPASDGRPVFSCSATDNVCAVQNVESRAPDLQATSFSALIYRADRTEVARVPIPDNVASMPLSPDGQFVAAGGLDDDNAVRVYRIADGTLVGSYTFAAADVL